VNHYILLKFVHIVSSVLLVGTGLGSAYYMFYGNRTRSVEVKAEISRLVVLIQPLTGFAMVYLAGFPITTPWIMLSVGLYLFAGACWLPVVWLQIQMAKIAADAHAQGTPLPVRYDAYRVWWERLGYPAFASMLCVFYLMVAKPALWE
jgi:uncharacterized membrane protein